MRLDRNILAAATVAAGIALAAAPASARDWHGGHGGPDGFDILHGVQLTDAQQSQVHQLMEAGRASTAQARSQMRALHDQIEAKLLSSGSVSEADLAPLLTQEEQLRTALDEARLDTVLKMRTVLTPAQLAQAASTHAQLESLHAQAEKLMAPAGDDVPPPPQ